MAHSIQRVTLGFMAAFGVLALVLGRLSIASPDLAQRDDNLRRVFAEQRIQRGAIVDRSDQVLAETIPLSGTLIRHYPSIDAAPALGYASINLGRSGVEEALDSVLRGPYDFIDQLLHREQRGRNVRVTIDLQTQRDLADRFQQPGAGVILSIPDGAVLALESHPSYDPNTLDKNWKALANDPSAPLLNRATQGLYQPGAIFETLLLADAVESGRVALTTTLARPTEPVAIGDLVLKCTQVMTSVMTMADAYAAACPAPFADLGATLGNAAMISITQRWRLDVPPPLEIRTATALTTTFDLSTTAALNAFATGQGPLTISPLQMALVAATIGNDGLMPTAYLVQDIQSIDGRWVPYRKGDSQQSPNRIISGQTAAEILSAMRVEDNIAGHGGIAISGNTQLSWFIGLAPIDQPRYAIAVLIESSPGSSGTPAENIGRAALKAVMGE